MLGSTVTTKDIIQTLAIDGQLPNNKQLFIQELL